jgi:hypothetical protein
LWKNARDITDEDLAVAKIKFEAALASRLATRSEEPADHTGASATAEILTVDRPAPPAEPQIPRLRIENESEVNCAGYRRASAVRDGFLLAQKEQMVLALLEGLGAIARERNVSLDDHLLAPTGSFATTRPEGKMGWRSTAFVNGKPINGFLNLKSQHDWDVVQLRNIRRVDGGVL